MHRPAWKRAAAVLLLAGSGCIPHDQGLTSTPAVSLVRSPLVRIGLVVDTDRTALGGGGALAVVDPQEGTLATVAAGEEARAVARNGNVVLPAAGRDWERSVLELSSVDSGGVVRVNGRDYRGTVELRGSPAGLVVVNRVELESYLIGVVGAEMGRRTPDELEALKAQAVVARTYAVKNRGKWGARPYDLVADVADQAYVGVAAENPLAAQAVAETRGEALTWQGNLIDAFFFSTCGGRTEDGTAAFAGAGRPYLRSVDDHDPRGVAWCAISPRFRWTESWARAALLTVLRKTLPANGYPVARSADLTDLRIATRTPSGRVASVELVGSGGRTTVSGQAVRRVLSPVEGGLLRSTSFTIRLARRGARLERVTIEGQGNGHGVGLCQWGAVGRARAGQGYLTILTSYFPGTELEHIY